MLVSALRLGVYYIRGIDNFPAAPLTLSVPRPGSPIIRMEMGHMGIWGFCSAYLQRNAARSRLALLTYLAFVAKMVLSGLSNDYKEVRVTCP